MCKRGYEPVRLVTVKTGKLAGYFQPVLKGNQDSYRQNQRQNCPQEPASVKSMLEEQRTAQTDSETKTELPAERCCDRQRSADQQICIQSFLEIPDKKKRSKNCERRECDIGHETVGQSEIEWIESQR